MNVVHSCFTLALIYGLLNTPMRYDLFSHKGNDFRISLCQGIDLCLLQQSLQPAYQSGRSLDCLILFSSNSLGSETSSRRTKTKQEDGEVEDNLSTPALGSVCGLSKDFQETVTVKRDEAATTTNLYTLRLSCTQMF